MKIHIIVGNSNAPLCATTRLRRWFFRWFGFYAADALANCARCKTVLARMK